MLDSFLTQIAFFKLRSTGLRVGGGGGGSIGTPFSWFRVFKVGKRGGFRASKAHPLALPKLL